MARHPQRRSIRRDDWDYRSPTTYFITISVHHRLRLFGVNDRGALLPSAPGKMVGDCWRRLPEQVPGIVMDHCMVMPDHFHGILSIEPLPRHMRPTLGRAMMAFKSITTVHYIRGVQELGWPAFDGRLWHRNYYDRILYSPLAIARTRSYIDANPQIHWSRRRR
jgi:REP element-mobilizing transposase RayT